jgi:hypothetical protein
LGFNNAVAHFVRGHSPYCTFCDLMLDPEPNWENALHIFYECNPVSQTIEEFFKRLTDNPNFQFSRTEYFTVFERRDYSPSKYYILTISAKLAISYIWECRNRKYIPNTENCWDSIMEKIATFNNTNGLFNKKWTNSGYIHNNP